MANFGIGTLAWSHEVGTAFALRDRAASAQCVDRGRRHIAALPAEADTQIVRKVGGLLIAQLVGKSRHCLHALQVGEILCRNAVQHGDDQVARIGETQHRVAPHRYNRVGDAVTVEPVTAGAERQIGDPTGTCCGRRGSARQRCRRRRRIAHEIRHGLDLVVRRQVPKTTTQQDPCTAPAERVSRAITMQVCLSLMAASVMKRPG